MSYQQIPNEAPEPPSYDAPRVEGDNIPDDFKYSVDVASCELPIRQMFIRKVYSLLLIQIAATVLVGYIIRYNLSIRDWGFNNLWLLIVAGIGSIGFAIATHVKARSYPVNLILLSLFTICEAYLLGFSCALVESDILVQALLITLVIFLGLTLFAFQTKYDFASWEGAVGIGLWCLIGWGFVLFFFGGNSKGVELVYSGIGAVIFCIYVVIDTQKIMRTAHLDDEIVATLSLYLDVLNLFLFILRILQNQRES